MSSSILGPRGHIVHYHVRSVEIGLNNLYSNGISVHLGKRKNLIEKPNDVDNLAREFYGSSEEIISHINGINTRIKDMGSPAVIRAFLSLGKNAIDVATPFTREEIWSKPVYLAIQKILPSTMGKSPEDIWILLKNDPDVNKFFRFAAGAETQEDHNLIDNTWFAVLSKHHPASGYHCEEASSVIKAICRAEHFSEEETAVFTRGALLHDIGKICVPSEILSKKEKYFTDEDYEQTKIHVPIGHSFLEHCSLYKKILAMINYHHIINRYPSYLDFDNPPFEGILCAAADIFAAAISGRYKKPKKAGTVFKEMEKTLAKLPHGQRVLDKLKDAYNHDPTLLALVKSFLNNKKETP